MEPKAPFNDVAARCRELLEELVALLHTARIEWWIPKLNVMEVVDGEITHSVQTWSVRNVTLELAVTHYSDRQGVLPYMDGPVEAEAPSGDRSDGHRQDTREAGGRVAPSEREGATNARVNRIRAELQRATTARAAERGRRASRRRGGRRVRR